MLLVRSKIHKMKQQQLATQKEKQRLSNLYNLSRDDFGGEGRSPTPLGSTLSQFTDSRSQYHL